MTGPLSPFAQSFAAELARHGYRPSAVANQLRLIAHLSRWLQAQHLDARHLTGPMLDKFLATRRAKGYVLWLSARALTPFLDHLRDRGFQLPPPSNSEPSPSEELLDRYRTYLLNVRGIANTTARGYVDTVRPFVVGRARDGQFDWAGLTGADVIAFVHLATRHLAIGSAQLLGTALRSLLTYLHIEGLLRRPLSAAVPSVAGSKHAGLPRALESGEVERLMAACDRRTRTGRRDFAILMLLVRLGLRAGEVCRLSLDDSIGAPVSSSSEAKAIASSVSLCLRTSAKHWLHTCDAAVPLRHKVVPSLFAFTLRIEPSLQAASRAPF